MSLDARVFLAGTLVIVATLAPVGLRGDAGEPPGDPRVENPRPDPEMPPLLARWKLDEGQGDTVADSSGHGLTGTLRGTKGKPVWIRTAVGNALSFGGVDGIVEFKTTLADLKIPFSISLCVRPASRQVQYADTLGNHGEPYVGLVMQQDGDKLNSFGFGYGDGKGWQGTKTVQLKAQAWQHLVVVCDGENAVFHVNGEEKSRNPAKGPFKANPKLTFRLGQGYASGRYLNGALADVRVYAGALSVEAVKSLAKAAKPLIDSPADAGPPDGHEPKEKPPAEWEF
jgi:hypothetical protein